MDELEISSMSAVQMAAAVREKQLSPVEITGAILGRIDRLNPEVNAFCTLTADEAMRQAQEAEAAVLKGARLGPLHGVPVSVKDSIPTRGIRTTAGSRIYEDYIPEQDAVAVERIRAAGAVVLGKTNMCEFGWLALSYNDMFGETRNPWSPEHMAGGSSGGAAAAVALGMGPVAVGSDAGGSIRVPSSFCGVFGLKPTFGLVPSYPDFPGREMAFAAWANLLHTGPITSTVEDAALLLEVLAGRDDRDHKSLPLTGLSYLPLEENGLKGLKVAWSKDLGHVTVEPEVARIAEKAAGGFAGLGADVEEASPGPAFPEASFSTVIGVGLAIALKDRLAEWRDRMDPGLVRFVERSMDKSGLEFSRACLDLMEYKDAMRPFFEKYDLLLTPAVAVPPFRLGERGAREIGGQKVSPLNWMALLCPFNITGNPSASVPCGWTESGLPVGLQVVGRRLGDATVLKAARAYEQAYSWREKRPGVG